MKKPVWTQAKKERVRQAFQGWLDSFHILPSVVSYDWQENPCKADGEGSFVHFEVNSAFPYRQIQLICYPISAECDDDDTDRFLLHEAVHVILAPINSARYEPWATYKQWVEFVTENITHYIWECRYYDDEQKTKIKKLEAEVASLKRKRKK